MHLLIVLIQNIVNTGSKNNKTIALISISLIIAFVMGSLLVFETYFMCFNLTMSILSVIDRLILT